jgi:hypothetical protein
MMRQKARSFFLYLLLMIAGGKMDLYGQAVWENNRTEVYNYLYRMAQKGLIEFEDNVRPISRLYIQSRLDSLALKTTALSKTEARELQFYLKEYTDSRLNEGAAKPRFFKNDSLGRWRFLDINTNGFMMRMDPVLTAATIGGTNRSVKQYSSGLTLYGYVGKRWSYYFSFNDVNEKGKGIDTLRAFTPETGIVTRIASDKQSHNYAELRGGVSYGFKNGSLSFAYDQNTWGYGDNGRIVLSTKAPSYPFFRLDYKPLKWLSFYFMHGWLNSNVVDVARSYRTGVNIYDSSQVFYLPKYFSIHSLSVTPTKGLDITFGEAILYNDPAYVGYLIPVMFFKAYDNLINNNNINAGSNGQMFFQISSRNHIPRTHLYGSMFIDEISVSNVFDEKKSRNQLGVTIGASTTDVLLRYLTIGLEYTRINPFVYRNLIPAQNYTHSDYLLGDWMGNNADRFIFSLRYTPLPKLKLAGRYQFIRKGGAGTFDQQYYQQPQPPFLFDRQFDQTEMEFRASYEWVNRLNLYGIARFQQNHSYTLTPGTNANMVSFGISYGL